MPITCEVDFDGNNPMKVIYAGQLLRGMVRLKSTEHLNVRSIFIRIQGTAHVQWQEGTGDNSRIYTGGEDYLNERTYFVNRSTYYAGGEVPLLPGTYNYPFQCMLPPDLPTSFEGEYGHIRYTTCVVIDIPLLPDTTFEHPFTVVKAVNLNTDPALREPVIVEKIKTFSPFLLCCCHSSKPMTIVARIPVGGYTSGQLINLEFNVKNDSDQTASKFVVKLIKQITYFVCENSTRQKQEIIPIAEKETHGCDVGREENYCVTLVVPSVPPTDFSTSNIIKVNYLIRIIGSVPCFHINPVVDLPITIGSYPIQDVTPVSTGYPHPNTTPSDNTVSQQITASQVPAQNNYSTFTQSAAPIAPFPNDNPPTYMQATHSNAVSNNFIPKYPTFNHTTPYSNGN